jgi:hypothetical protein
MKKTIVFSLLLLLAGASVTAQKTGELAVSRKKVNVGSFDKIRIDATINVVLYEDVNDTQITIEGQGNSIDEIQLKVQNGELVLAASSNKNYKKKAVVSIPVNNLKRITLNQDAMLISMNVLQSEIMDLQVNSDCWMNLKLSGRLNLLQGDAQGKVTFVNSKKEIILGE